MRTITFLLHCVRLISAWNGQVGDSRTQGENAYRNMEDTMPQSNHDYAADLHIYAAHAHTAAAAAHQRSDHEAAEELSSRAQDYSMEAAEKTNAVARQKPEPVRA